MSNSHRLIWIDTQIRNKRYPNAVSISRHFEISVRQGARDIEYLRYSLGAPLAYSHLYKGYYYTDEAFNLPGVYLTPQERATLRELGATYSLIPENHASNIAKLFQRISGPGTKEDITSPSGPHMITGVCAATVSFSRPGLVDFSGVVSQPCSPSTYFIQAPDYRALLLFLLSCPCTFRILSPNWLRLRFRKIVEKALEDLSN